MNSATLSNKNQHPRLNREGAISRWFCPTIDSLLIIDNYSFSFFPLIIRFEKNITILVLIFTGPMFLLTHTPL